MDSGAPIGVFDSGLGGLSVLAKLLLLMPNEKYLFFGDSGNNPYGTKPLPMVKDLTWAGVNYLLSRGVKALVIACNTATSAVIEDLREQLRIPVFGIEPAVKPALTATDSGKILIMATPLTVAEAKFRRLMESLPKREDVSALACPGLAELIERADMEKVNLRLRELFKDLKTADYSSVVLGCTHYPLIRKEIQAALGKSVRFFDGGEGLARHVQHVLAENNLLNASPQTGMDRVEYHITGEAPAEKTARARQIVETLLAGQDGPDEGHE